jgi:hypothetical protein
MMTPHKILIGCAAVIVAVLVSSCGPSPKPLVSTPPAKGLKVAETTWGDGILLKKFTYPQGVYRPQAEDKNGYYYHPQGQIQVFDSGLRYGTAGGVYWKKDSVNPEHLFFKAPFGGYGVVRKSDLQAVPIR